MFNKSKKDSISIDQLKPGDIFLEYASGGHRAIRFAQIFFNSTKIKYSNYVHGGIIISDTELMHADGGNNLDINDIDDVLSYNEYYIFRNYSGPLKKV